VKINTVKEKLAAGQPAVGTWLGLASPIAAEHMAHLGWDWLVVDTEHSPVGFETTVQCFQAIATTDTIPMARVAWNDPTLIKRLLDAGALGLVVPMVNTREEAEKAVAAMKYPPDGFRSLGGGRCLFYGEDYFSWANDQVACIVQIEHIQAVRNAEEILSVKGVDACFIGPNDLAGSMGIKPDLGAGDPRHEEAIQEVLRAAKKVGTPAGIHVPSAEHVSKRIAQGFQFIALTNDAGFMKAGAKQAQAAIKGWAPRA